MWIKTKKLTRKQKAKIREYKDKYFKQATTTKPANRVKAEKAARKLVKIGGIKIQIVEWVMSSTEGKTAYEKSWNLLTGSLKSSVSKSFQNLTKDLFTNSLNGLLKKSFWDSLNNTFIVSFRDQFEYSFKDLLNDSFAILFSDPSNNPLQGSLNSLLWDSLSTSTQDLLDESLWNSLWDTGWLAFNTYITKELNMRCSKKHRESLRLHNEIAENCFALWVVPSKIILCERPKTVEIRDGNLVGLTWRKEIR